MSAGTLIIGAGQSGLSVASRLRGLGYDHPIVLIGDEAHPPYQRPPLSKKFLSGVADAASLQLRGPQYFVDQCIELRINQQATHIDTTAHRVGLADGSTLRYEALVLATGTRARPLPESLAQGLSGIYLLRGQDDALAFQRALHAGMRLLVVGGGFVGLEAAATARALGLDVTVVEQGERILQRVAGYSVSQRLRELHLAKGVRLLEQRRLLALRGTEGRVSEAVLDGDEVLSVDLVLVGIGALPNVELAQAAGLRVEDGIMVDATGRTSIEDVYACGDCARFPGEHGSLRFESVQNAIALGECVAQTIAGQSKPYVLVPWFWSDQYDCKLQMAGLIAGHDRVVTRDAGERPTQGASFWYYQGPRLLAVEALNDAAAFIQGRRWLEQRQSPNADELSNPLTPLKSVPTH